MKSPWIIGLSVSDSANKSLLCFPHAGGGVNSFRKWANYLPKDVGLYGVCLPGRESRLEERLTANFFEVVDCMSRELKEWELSNLYVFGHSMGASLAYETVANLEKETGETVAGLFVSGREGPSCIRRAAVHKLDESRFCQELLRVGGIAKELLDEPELREMYLPIIRNDYKLIEMYQPTGLRIGCPVRAYYGLDDDDVSAGEIEAWSDVTTKSFKAESFKGGHFFFAQNPEFMLKSLVEMMELGR